MFGNSVSKPTTLYFMRKGLESPKGEMVIINRRIASQEKALAGFLTAN